MKTKVKLCSRCKKKKKKLEKEFYKDKSRPDGKTRTCSACLLLVSRTKGAKEKAAAWRKAHPGNQAAWAKAHPKDMREVRARYYKAHRAEMIAAAKARSAMHRGPVGVRWK